jgi:transglutaminase-like putative cysteine protease
MIPYGKSTYLLSAILLLCHTVFGEAYDSIAHRYKNEHAVITNYNERLVINFESGKLVAKSFVTMQKLMISDLAPGMHNRDYVFHSSTFQKLSDIEANELIPSKSGYKKNKIDDFRDVHTDRDQVFYDDSRVTVISYSGLVKGSVTELKYAIEHTDPHMLPDFDFQEDLPIVKASFEVNVPKYVEMEFALKGEHTSWIKQTKEESNSTVTYIFTATDIPAYKKFNDVPTYFYYIPHVIPYIKSYKIYAEGKATDMLSNTDQLYKYLYKYISNVNMVEDSLLNKTVVKITKNDHTPREKAVHIYQWVQKNMHYIAFEDGLEGFVPRDAKDICKRKYGDCKDMTSILVAICRKAGLDAHFTWIGTRDLPYIYKETPLPLMSDHMICALKLDDQWIFMDGTHPLIPFGENPDMIQGKEAMIAIDPKNYKIITVPETPAGKNVLIDSTFMSINEGQLKGTVKQHYEGYKAWEIGAHLMYRKNDDREKYIKSLTERGSDKYLQARYDLAASDTGSKSINIVSDFSLEDHVQKAGKQYFVNLNLDRLFADKYIDTRDRTVPYFFKYKGKTSEVVTLEIPKGYKVAHLPPAAHGSIDGLWSYTVTYKADKKNITLIKEYELNSLTVAQNKFADNNKMVDGLKNIYKESVVLSAN